MTFTPSRYQQAIFAWIVEGRGNAFVDAVAGSGKTTTLMQAAGLIAGDGLFLAFGKDIATELGNHLKGSTMNASTIHSAAFRSILAVYRRTRVEPKKYDELVSGFLAHHIDHPEALAAVVGRDRQAQQQLAAQIDEMWGGNGRAYSPEIRKLVKMTMLTLTDAADAQAVAGLAAHFGVDVEPDLWDFTLYAVRRIVERGREDVECCIDFDDQLCLCATDRRVRPPQYSWVFVDEAQDLNQAQLACVRKMVRPGGRLLFVGDRAQAIMGFAGADNRSVDAIIAACECAELPLSICYRCPSSHLELARELVPTIENRPNAPEGTIADVDYGLVADQVHEGDLVLCRTTAPLVRLCLALIAARVPAQVKGRDIGAGLIALVKRVAKRRGYGSFATDFLPELANWASEQCEKAGDGEAQSGARAAITDRAAALRVVVEAGQCTCIADVTRYLQQLFGDGTASVQLSTVHRAKGLEADRVWILHEELMPHPMARLPWQREQEHHLRYVALTRSKSALFFIVGSGADDE